MTAPDNRVIVRLRSGAEYALRDAEHAREIYPNGEIIGHIDGRPYVPDVVQEIVNDASDDDSLPTPEEVEAFLRKQSRASLDELATGIEIDPKDYRTKDELIAVLLDATTSGVLDGGPDA